jgi:hypothetical protein
VWTSTVLPAAVLTRDQADQLYAVLGAGIDGGAPDSVFDLASQTIDGGTP